MAERAETASADALAEEEARLLVLDRELAVFANQARRARLSQAIAGVSLGALLLPAGIVLLQCYDGPVQTMGVGLTTSGAAQLLLTPSLFIPSDLEKIQANHEQRKAAGMATTALMQETEQEWRRVVKRKVRLFRWLGGVQLGIGIAAVPVGLASLLKDPHPPKWQTTLGATLIGFGAPFVMNGSRMLFTANETELAWQARMATKAVHAVNLVPINGGAMIVAQTVF